jgi:hypothetical protein
LRDLAVRWRIKLHVYQGSMQKKWAEYKESLKYFRIALLRAVYFLPKSRSSCPIKTILSVNGPSLAVFLNVAWKVTPNRPATG